ncbi:MULTISPECIES: ACT domain-containing protein [unclassified Enterococcus]|uniref:ACT domain-containing protein n=1 Tax=unclassified Enterococcus TaxID=2608891 RepID=UPI0015537413|nr:MULTISPECIES: ACT domain-containing protein [unclassified Enterococcus]MBS7576017.1 ACT domain-containing protein [Enterococcus sp. MMGLQ5-2]MBS7583250.1 ACT domain-containing protein [Enterococcus sp. MMGLQ5-1]NPD11110.1 ACT domain-containing protein [Enterococcus sp. MMGLQ5-1]NPD35853.1 ACT domain-containing protein [Enterococcus sp. MMGLQ5-2]
MILKKINIDLSVIQVENLHRIDLSINPIFIGKTQDEISVVLPTIAVPDETINREDGWSGLKIEGILDFSLVGILAKISTLLAENHISIFAISTYNTDYILIKKVDLNPTIKILSNNGYSIK